MENTTSPTTIVDIALAFGTIAYVIITFLIYWDSRKSNKIINRPFVTTETLGLTTDNQMLSFVCKNHGNTPASDFSVDTQLSLLSNFSDVQIRPQAHGKLLIPPHLDMHFADNLGADNLFIGTASVYIRLTLHYKGLDNKAKTRYDDYKKDAGIDSPFQRVFSSDET